MIGSGQHAEQMTPRMNKTQSEKSAYCLEPGIWIWDNRGPSKEHIVGIVLRFQALQTGVIATE